MAEEKKQEKTEENKEEKKEEEKVEKKPAEAAKEKVEKKEEKPKKTEAVALGRSLPLSTKHCVAICKFIRGKEIEEAVALLGDVIKMKKAVPMLGELPHRKGKGMERGRYPVKAAQHFIKLLKQLAANAIVNEFGLEKGRIECKADKANRPYKRFGVARFKRTHVMLKLKIPEKKKVHKGRKKK